MLQSLIFSVAKYAYTDIWKFFTLRPTEPETFKTSTLRPDHLTGYSYCGSLSLSLSLFYSPSTFARTNGDVAIFNYGPLAGTFKVDLVAEAGMPAYKSSVACTDAWDGTSVDLDGSRTTPALSVKIDGRKSMLISCRA